ncbi:GIY-YIG nuclease family protein [archaeon]|nr:GIY-YIG nuclease family protein [archaeon]MBT7128633.1 GIY-YIG nuclease family protein [archaeon]
MSPVTMETPLVGAPTGGVYLFSENDNYLYVGRSKRRLNTRLRGHIKKSSKDSPLAFKLAREATGNTEVSYSGANIRKELLADPEFSQAYQNAKARIEKMDIRWVHEPHPIRQALLEIYVSVVLKTPYNDFDTH